MKTRSEMKLEKIKLMKEAKIGNISCNKGFFSLYRQRTENREKRMWSNYQNYNMW